MESSIYAELINIVRHMRAYPDDGLEATLRNVFDFDVYKPETTEKLAQVLAKHGFGAFLLSSKISGLHFCCP